MHRPSAGLNPAEVADLMEPACAVRVTDALHDWPPVTTRSAERTTGFISSAQNRRACPGAVAPTFPS
jgi:hypothetical protein